TKPRRAGATAKRSSASSGSSSPGSRIRAWTRRSMFCVRSASPRCGKATTTRWPARTSAASSFSASESPRAASAGRCTSTANGELTALLDALDTFVAGEREALRERFDSRLGAEAKLDRLRPRGGGWHPLCERRGRSADETAVREHVQRAGALPDEVRRRLEP